MILYNLHIAILFVASCHVDKEVIWRTTVNEDISTLQNIQDTNLLVLYKHLFLHLAKVAQIFTYFTQYILESIETDQISFRRRKWGFWLVSVIFWTKMYLFVFIFGRKNTSFWQKMCILTVCRSIWQRPSKHIKWDTSVTFVVTVNG